MVIKFYLILLQSIASVIMLCVWFLGDESWFGLTLAVAIVISVFSVLSNRDNLLFFSRTVFISWVGLIPALALYLGGYFAWRMSFVQTHYVGFVLTILTTFALFSSQIGLESGKKIRVKKHGIDLLGNERLIYYIILVLLAITGFLIAMSRGGLIFFAGYASDAQQANKVQMPFQNLQSIAILLSLFALVVYYRIVNLKKVTIHKKRNMLFMLYIAMIFYVAVWCQLFRGARMDPLSLLFGVSILYLLYQKKHLRLTTKVLFYLLLAFFLIQVWGGIRHDFDSIGIKKIISIAQQLYKGREKDGVPIYFWQGTMNNLSLSVATVIYAIDKGDLGYRYGASYIDYLARTPPAAVYPDRPRSLAWLSADLYGGGGAGGGFNEMAETYLNFGIFGSLFIPGLISFIISYSLRVFMANKYNIFRSIVFLSVLAVFFRGLLYQTFTFYKTFVTALVLYCIVLFFHLIILSCKENKPAELTMTQSISS